MLKKETRSSCDLPLQSSTVPVTDLMGANFTLHAQWSVKLHLNGIIWRSSVSSLP